MYRDVKPNDQKGRCSCIGSKRTDIVQKGDAFSKPAVGAHPRLTHVNSTTTQRCIMGYTQRHCANVDGYSNINWRLFPSICSLTTCRKFSMRVSRSYLEKWHGIWAYMLPRAQIAYAGHNYPKIIKGILSLSSACYKIIMSRPASSYWMASGKGRATIV